MLLQEYEVKDNRSTVAVTAGNKAFIFWRVSDCDNLLVLRDIFLSGCCRRLKRVLNLSPNITCEQLPENGRLVKRRTEREEHILPGLLRIADLDTSVIPLAGDRHI